MQTFNHDANYSLESAKAWPDPFTQRITKNNNSKTQGISFSSFHSNFLKSNLNQLDINVLLPILDESINARSVFFIA